MFFSKTPNKPYSADQINNVLQQALQLAGITTTVTFHCWRHFYTTSMRTAGLPDSLLQQQTGHKTSSMLDRYGNHRQDSGIDKIRETQARVFYFETERKRLNINNGGNAKGEVVCIQQML